MNGDDVDDDDDEAHIVMAVGDDSSSCSPSSCSCARVFGRRGDPGDDHRSEYQDERRDRRLHSFSASQFTQRTFFPLYSLLTLLAGGSKNLVAAWKSSSGKS